MMQVFRCPHCLGDYFGIIVSEKHRLWNHKYVAVLDCPCGHVVVGKPQKTVNLALHSLYNEQSKISVRNYRMLIPDYG